MLLIPVSLRPGSSVRAAAVCPVFVSSIGALVCGSCEPNRRLVYQVGARALLAYLWLDSIASQSVRNNKYCIDGYLLYLPVCEQRAVAVAFRVRIAWNAPAASRCLMGSSSPFRVEHGTVLTSSWLH